MTTAERFRELGIDKFITMLPEDLRSISSDYTSKDMEVARVYQFTGNPRVQVLEIVWADGSLRALAGKVGRYIIYDREIDGPAGPREFEGRLELIHDSSETPETSEAPEE